MRSAVELGGYSGSDSDNLRNAISKKKEKEVKRHRQKFIEGAVNNDIERDTATAIFDEWEEFARYGFNKSHAAAYGTIAVQTAYLKAHYPAEFLHVDVYSYVLCTVSMLWCSQHTLRWLQSIAGTRISEFIKDVAQNVSRFDWQNFQDEELRRKFLFMAYIGASALDMDDYRSVSGLHRRVNTRHGPLPIGEWLTSTRISSGYT